MIESAYQVLATTVDEGAGEVFARAALSLKDGGPDKPAPIAAPQILMLRRFDDRHPDLWSVFTSPKKA